MLDVFPALSVTIAQTTCNPLVPVKITVQNQVDEILTITPLTVAIAPDSHVQVILTTHEFKYEPDVGEVIPGVNGYTVSTIIVVREPDEIFQAVSTTTAVNSCDQSTLLKLIVQNHVFEIIHEVPLTTIVAHVSHVPYNQITHVVLYVHELGLILGASG